VHRARRIRIGITACWVLFATAGCAGDIYKGQTRAERDLVDVALKVQALAREPSSNQAADDARVDALLAKGRRIWTESPANSRTVVTGPGASGYEMKSVYRALVDYYIATGRTGRAIPVLEEATSDSKRLGYYTHWQGLTLEHDPDLLLWSELPSSPTADLPHCRFAGLLLLRHTETLLGVLNPVKCLLD
jgi:hypothetical protein